MVYKNFRYNVIFRILLLVGFILLFIYAITRTPWVITTAVIGGTIIYLIVDLILYVDRVNREFSRFLAAIKHRDFSQTFASDGRGKSFNELRDSFNLIIQEFQKISGEKEIHHQYLKTIVEHVSVGIISYREDGEIALINNAAKEMFGLSYINNIHSLSVHHLPVLNAIKTLRSEENQLVKTEVNNEPKFISVHKTVLNIRQERFEIVSFQNIRNELEEKEIDAWQKLIRVLTHEIMNSVTPITSLTSTSIKLISDYNKIEKLPIDDIRQSLLTIEKRSKGLLHFVDLYRSLTLMPKPNPVSVKVLGLFENIKRLFSAELSNKNIQMRLRLSDEDFEITVDPELFEQVLINLIINAIDAVETSSEPQIQLKAYAESGKIYIQVEDNGAGISDEVMDKIFVPFYTTKKKGSGIGLSLSRQIVRSNGGTISAKSSSQGTVFTIRL